MSNRPRSAEAGESTSPDGQQVIASFLAREKLLSAVILTFLASRLWLLFVFPAAYGDTALYGTYARLGVDRGQTAYRDFKIEYPPLAWWLMAAPRWLAEERYGTRKLSKSVALEYYASYVSAFRKEMFAADLVCFALMFLIGSKFSPLAGWALPGAYGLISAAQPHLIYHRLDIVLLAFFLACIYGWLESLEDRPGAEYWGLGSYFCLGLGASFKIIPILIAPFLLVGDMRHGTRGRMVPRVLALALGTVQKLV